MQTGYNTNIRYRGVLFHVQSEDSGREHPHVITHLYYGGTILASEKSSYADKVESADLEGVVKAQMENQHKAVLKRLVGAQFDDVIRTRLGSDFLGEKPPPPPATEAATTLPDVEAQPEDASLSDAAPAEVVEAVVEAEAAAEPAAEGERAFGEGIVSEKPLDEVILGYLVENARKRKRPQK